MNKFLPLLTCLFFLSTLPVFATSDLPIHSHQRLFLGPDVFGTYFENYHFYRDDTQKLKYFSLYYGLRFGYEFTKPNAIYLGTDTFLAHYTDKVTFEASYYVLDQKLKQIEIDQIHSFFLNIEQRIGYTFQSSCCQTSSLTPFVGLGLFFAENQCDYSFSKPWTFYGTLGVKIHQKFHKDFDIGCNLKMILSATEIFYRNNLTHQTIRSFIGYEIALPMRWYYGMLKKWDFEFQPYFLKFNILSSSNILGVRFLTGYSF